MASACIISLRHGARSPARRPQRNAGRGYAVRGERQGCDMSADTSVPEQWEAGLDTPDSGLPDAVLRDSPAGVAFLGGDHRFAWVNPALAQLYGRAPEEFPGRTVAEALPPLDAARAEAAMGRVLADGVPAVETFTVGSLPASPSARGSTVMKSQA